MPLSHLLFSFEGRIRRSQWWITHLAAWGAVIAATLVLSMLIAALRLASPGEDGAGGIVGVFVGVLAFPALIALAWIHLATSVKRLHDQDMSGWLILLQFVPLLGLFFVIIVLGCLDGTRGSNRYGSSAKYPEDQARAFA